MFDSLKHGCPRDTFAVLTAIHIYITCPLEGDDFVVGQCGSGEWITC